MQFLWIALSMILLYIIIVIIASIIAFRFAICRPKRDLPNYAETHDVFAPYRSMIHAGKDFYKSHISREIWIKSFDGLWLKADLLQAANPPRGVILMMHGYHNIGIDDFSCIFSFYHSLGYDMLVPDQRAHGKSEGKYICFGVKERYDCLSWVQKINEIYAETIDIYLQGISMGATTVTMAATLPLPSNVRGLIADCGFSSPHAIFKSVLHRVYHLPAFPVLSMTSMISKLIAGFGFDDADTITDAPRQTLPALLIHGNDDHFVPTEMTVSLFRKYGGEKELILVDNAGHGMSYLLDPVRCADRLRAFLEKNASHKS